MVGSPIAPEYVGVTPTIERQKKQHALEDRKREAAAAEEANQQSTEPTVQGPDVELPPLRPVGTR